MTSKPGHETADLPVGPAALVIAGLLALLLAGALVAWAMTAVYSAAHPSRAPNAEEIAAAEPAAPRLEVDGRADRLALEARVQAELTSYGWTDQRAGLAHIPIDGAMTLQARQGWPDADTPSNAAPSNTVQSNSALTNAAPSNAAAEPAP
jgi:hypothetical protein